MAKKTTKKNTKKSTSRATKKEVAKKVEQTLIETPNDEMEAALDEIEEGAKEIEQEEDAVFREKEASLMQEIEDFVDQDPPMIETISEPSYTPTEKEINQVIEVMNGDPGVVSPIDKIEEEAMAETFKDNNKNKKLINNMIGYSWNGMEIDYIL